MYLKTQGTSLLDVTGRLGRRAHLYLAYLGFSMVLLSAYILITPGEGFGMTYTKSSSSHSTSSQQGSHTGGVSTINGTEEVLLVDRPIDAEEHVEKAMEPREQAANATLGFQKLLVLSTKPSWRTRGLQAAAKLTGLEFTFPPQPPNGKETIEGFMAMSPAGDKTRPALGSAAAWLAHIDLLKYVISADLETAFIVEDDVDWDVRIKDQARLISDNVRAFRSMKLNVTDPLLQATREAAEEIKKAEEAAAKAVKEAAGDAAELDEPLKSKRSTHTPNTTTTQNTNTTTETSTTPDFSSDTTPYGTDWDVLWLGHCGSLGHDDAQHRRPMSFADPSRVPDAQFSGWARGYFLDAHLPADHRVVQESRMTICTFGYAVSRAGVRNVLKNVMKGHYEAFDVALHAHCSEGRLKCVTVNPTVFHHYDPSAGHGYVSPVREGDGKGKAKSETEFEGFMGSTANIVESARCHALWGKGCLREA